MVQGLANASTDFYHPQHPQARPRRQARLRLHPPRLPPGRPLVVRQSPLTPAAIIHWFLIQVLHGNTALTDVSLLAGRAFTASRLLPGLRPAPVGRLPDRPPRGGQDPGPCHRGRGTLVRPSRLADRRLVVLHARCRCAASLLRPAGQPGQGLRLPGGPHPALFHAGTGLLLEVFARRCGRMTWLAWAGFFPCCKAR